MATCPVCNKHVDYKYLRSENPKDEQGHDLGTWVSCEKEKHVYLKNKNASVCPFCSDPGFVLVKAQVKVKCLHKTDTGIECPARPYIFFEEGPPCFMNHIAKIVVV